MSLKVSFTLSDRDLAVLRNRMRAARANVKDAKPDAIITAARELVSKALERDTPEFVTERMHKLRELADMVEDDGFSLPASLKARVLGALAYFADPQDLIADDLPGVGLLDDAIMVELVLRELRHEIEAYEDFCSFRESTGAGDAEAQEQRRLKEKRRDLLDRIKRRRDKDKSAGWRTRLW